MFITAAKAGVIVVVAMTNNVADAAAAERTNEMCVMEEVDEKEKPFTFIYTFVTRQRWVRKSSFAPIPAIGGEWLYCGQGSQNEFCI